jgi:hypothetical protein
MTTQVQPAVPAPLPAQGSAQSAGQPHAMPRAAGRREGVAPLRDNPAQLLHLVLFVAGAVLLPAGLIVIGLGWYGVAHTAYLYDQNAYIVSGGILGLGITFVGGFLYFGSWLARIAADQKEAQRQLSDTLLLLADAVSHTTAVAGTAGNAARPAARPRDPGSVLVVAGNGTTVHRADCDLVAGRDDLRPAGPDAPNLTRCRLCPS